MQPGNDRRECFLLNHRQLWVLVALLGPAVIGALDRFRRRFLLEWAEPDPALEPAPAKISANVGTPA